MRSFQALTLVFTLVAPAALACEGHARAGADAAAVEGAKVVTAGAHKDCCAKDGKADKADCPHAAAKADCPHAARRAASGEHAVPAVNRGSGDCPHAAAAAKRAALAVPASGHELKATGKVLCAACDLGRASACRSMFQVENGSTFALCGDGLSADLVKLTKHGELAVTVHGRVTPAAEGDALLCIDGFSVGTI